MMIRVVSLVWGSAWERYGRTFARTFGQFWPGDVELVIVTDKTVDSFRGRQVALEEIEGYRAFHDRWSSDLRAMGHRPPPGTKTNENGYSWRHDAVKWMPQGLAPAAALEGMQDGDIFVWFDADTETLSPVPHGWIESLLGGGDVAALFRPRRHTEIGFYAMRIDDRTRRVLERFADFYRSDKVFDLPEWHSAYVWDRALETEPTLKLTNLNPKNENGHPWPASRLSEHTAHWKGKRKA